MREHGTGAVRRTSAGNVETDVGGVTSARSAPDPATRLAELYEALLPVVFGYCRARLREADAEDVTAEVFRAALDQLRREPERELSRGWFLTTARNRIIDLWRRDARWAPRLRDVAASNPTAVDDLATEGGGDTIEALDALSPIHRAVLVLHYLDDVPVRTIATMLDRSPVAVDSLLARARQSLSAQIDAEAGRP